MGKKEKNKKTKVVIGVVLGIVVVTVIVVAAVVLGLVFGVLSDDDGDGGDGDGGMTPQLEMLRQMVEPILDVSADPCEDFYQFACGGFESPNLTIGQRDGTFARTVGVTNTILQEILEGSLEDSTALTKAQQFYTSCIDTDRLNMLGVMPLLALIAETGGWDLIGMSQSDPWTINGEQFLDERERGSPAFFTISLSLDARNSSNYMLQVRQSGLTLVPELYSSALENITLGNITLGNITVENSTVEDVFVTAVTATLMALDPMGNTTEFKEAAKEIFDFEQSLANIWVSTVDQLDPERTYNPMPLRNLSTLWSDYDWTTLVDSYVRNVGGPMILPDEIVNVVTPDYFRQLSDVFSSVGVTTQENYAKWQLVRTYLPYVDEELAAIARQIQKLASGATVTERSAECIATTVAALPLAISNPFVTRTLGDSERENVNRIVIQVVRAWRERIQAAEWLDQSSRTASLEKLEAIEFIVGYPERILDTDFIDTLYRNLLVTEDNYFGNFRQFVNFTQSQQFSLLHQPVDRDEFLDRFGSSYATVNAFYLPNINFISILAGILVSSPFYDLEWPSYFQYGAIGGIIGQEIGHGFDDQGRQYTLNGNLMQWWSDGSIQNFIGRLPCFVDQYSDYSMTFPNSSLGLNTTSIFVDGELTLSENLADDIGVKSSFQAYRNLNLQEEGFSVGNQSLTADQLFFIAWSQIWCTVYDDSGFSFLVQTLSDVHSPGPFRVTGPLVNSPEFAEAYNCSVGSPMNPSNNCSLW